MYCNNCGKEIRDGAAFCNHCGAKANNRSKGSNAVIKSINDYAEIVVPKALLDKFPKLNALAFVGILIALVFVLIVTVSIVTHGGHDLEGTYRYEGNETLTSFTFSKDGTVTATNDFCPNDLYYGETFYGKYKKTGRNKYEIHLTKKDGKDSSFDSLQDINVKKENDNTLKIAISSRFAYIENYKTYYKSY